MSVSPDYRSYASKMRGMVAAGADLEADARFVDMLVRPRARILDVGCGIGTAVNALRQRGHEAYGIDPSEEVLDVANDLFGSQWYRKLNATDLSKASLAEQGLPQKYDCLLMAGNVPAFLDPSEFRTVLNLATTVLAPGGYVVTGTSTRSRGGPEDQDKIMCSVAMLSLSHRFSNWHLEPFDNDPWCVSVFAFPGTRTPTDGPDGIFILPM